MLGHGAGGIISRSLGSQDTHAATKFASTSFFTALTFGAVPVSYTHLDVYKRQSHISVE